MSPRARAAKPSALSSNFSSKSKKKSSSLRKITRRSSVQKKSSPTKQQPEQTSLTQPRQKRLSSLTAATLLQYCTSILSPARKLKSNSKKISSEKTSTTIKRQISNGSETKIELHIPIRTRREASSHASAMIMQQNEIERSRCNYSSLSSIRRHRSKNKDDTPAEPFKFNIPSVPPSPAPEPSVANVSNPTATKSIHLTDAKYPLLTEEILAEHNRLQETLPTKNDNLLKWTQDLASCGRLSPPYPEDEIPITKPANSKETTLLVNTSSRSLEQLSTTNNVPAPTFLFPSSAYPLDLRSFYSLMPCWQYPSWPFQSSAYQIPLKRHRTLTHPETKRKKSAKLDSIVSKKEALTFHLHTHHHHHIHNSKSSSLLKAISEKSSSPFVKTKTILPLGIHNALTQDDQPMSPTIENEVLNLSIKKRHEENLLRLNDVSSPEQNPIGKDQRIPKANQTTILSFFSSPSPSIIAKINPIQRVLKRRSASAATTNSPTIVSITGRNSRGKRTISATSRKRSYSPASVSLPLTNNQSRKKQKVLHNWILFGKSEQKLVSIDADKPPVFRECYSSIRHITEKDVIKSYDCVILRSETGTHHGATAYLAKVKWFWEEPITGEIQMSLIWYYHPEHTELPLRIRERFLPNELLASKYWDSLSVACIEDKCYVLNFNEYNRYCLREKSVNLFEHSEAVGQLKFLLNKNSSTVQHRPLPAKTVDNQNIFFCRYVYDYRVRRVLKNPTFFSTVSSM